MKPANTLHLLLLTQQAEQAEAIISSLRADGVATRGHKVTSSQDFSDSLEDQHWDLLILDQRNSLLNLSEAQTKIQSLDKDLACLLLTEEFDPDLVLSGFRDGAVDVVAAISEQHLLHAIKREAASSRQRFANSQAQSKLEEATQRADQLMSDTQDAIAYIADGMHIQANEAYAQIFAYDDADEIAALPIIDLIAEIDQEKFKAFWRHYNNSASQEEATLNFTAVNQNFEEFAAHMSLSLSMFDGEACTQMMVRTNASEQDDVSAATVTITGLAGRASLFNQLHNAFNHVDAKLGPASLILFQLDKYQHLLNEQTLSAGKHVLSRAAEVINKHKQKDDFVAEYGDNLLALISHQDNENSLDSALKLCKLLDDDICDLGDHTAHYSCTVGIAGIDVDDAEVICDNAYEAIKQAYQVEDSASAMVYIPPVDEAAELESEQDLGSALEHDNLYLLFQPIISLRGDSREHYEVFSRMRGKDGDYRPDIFLQQAKDTQLDRWVIVEATKQLATHRANDHDARLIINLTANALLDSSLVEWISVALKAANLPYDAISFQFSETDISNHLTHAKEVLPALRQLGCLVAISHFGRAGAEPLKTLKHVDTDYIKIDSEFILSMQEENSDPQVLKALVNAISERNSMSIVPCVEHAGILATLWQVGVHYIQGNYLQAPSDNMSYEFTEIA